MVKGWCVILDVDYDTIHRDYRDFLSAMIEIFWGESLGERAHGVVEIIKASR